MTRDELRELVAARPFVPFVLLTREGEEFVIATVDTLYVPPVVVDEVWVAVDGGPMCLSLSRIAGVRPLGKKRKAG